MLKERFFTELDKSGLITQNDKIIVGVSGGIDSITLISLLAERGFSVAIAHCNFSLRGEESDGDEQFVREFALTHRIPFHATTFDTQQEAALAGESIQIAARRLRYDWFEALCKEHRYTKIAIAHNADDTIETVFINLSRGTGIRGLTGIPEQRDKVVRPLLFASRKQITEYAASRGLRFREDHTNSETKYLRNKIRHQIVPLFRELNGDFDTTMLHNIKNIEASRDLLQYCIKSIYNRAVSSSKERTIIDIAPIQETPNPAYTLFEIIRQWNFAPDQAQKMIRALEKKKSGQRFFSRDYEAVTDRSRVLIDPKQADESPISDVLLYENSAEQFNEVLFTARTIDHSEVKSLKTEHNTALFDRDTLDFPLLIRRIQKGDRMTPLGMKGSKKISDLLTDQKIALLDKKEQIVLLCREEIVWLTGIRTSENYKVSDKSRKLVEIKTFSKQ